MVLFASEVRLKKAVEMGLGSAMEREAAFKLKYAVPIIVEQKKGSPKTLFQGLHLKVFQGSLFQLK